MKLYTENYPAPNPRKVHIYLAEKGIDGVERVHTSMMKRMHKAPDFLAKNSLGQVPVLETDDGRFLSESVAICRYFEALHPDRPAVRPLALRDGRGRDVDPPQRIPPVDADGPGLDQRRSAHRGRQSNQFKEYGVHMRRVGGRGMKWIDKELSGGGQFLVGDYFSMADIVLLCGLDFAKFVDIADPGRLPPSRRLACARFGPAERAGGRPRGVSLCGGGNDAKAWMCRSLSKVPDERSRPPNSAPSATTGPARRSRGCSRRPSPTSSSGPRRCTGRISTPTKCRSPPCSRSRPAAARRIAAIARKAPATRPASRPPS